MLHAISARRAVGLLALSCALLASPARGDLVLLGSDYLQTVQPTFFVPLGPANPLMGVPIGPGNTDTIVRRHANCALSLSTIGSQCTIPIEMVALQLVSVQPIGVRVRESPSLTSSGQMQISSDGSGNGGTFNSFFDVFFELSLDDGNTWQPQGPLHLNSVNTGWTTTEPLLLVDGLVGDPLANRHTNKGIDCPSGMRCVDFYLVGDVTEQHLDGSTHTARNAVPEPAGLPLVGLALALMAVGTGRRAGRQPGR